VVEYSELSFQISQMMRSARERKAFRGMLCREEKMVHQPSGDEVGGQFAGCRSGKPIQRAISVHGRRV
jgi:hypothetical protein